MTSSGPDKMAKGGEIDDLVTRISEGVFAKINSNLDTKLDQVTKSVSSVCEKVKAVKRRVEDAEQRISDTEDSVSQLLAKLEHTEAQLSEAINRLEDQENRSRHNNIKIVNLPECTEGTNAKDFFETWLPKTLNLMLKNNRIKMDRCHRTPALLWVESTRPRVVYIRLHNYADKQLIMQKARSMGEILESGNRIHLFEDFSPTVEKRRHEFLVAKKSLQTLGIPYRMLFPAVLSITHDSKVQLFKTAAETQRYVEELQKDKT